MLRFVKNFRKVENLVGKFYLTFKSLIGLAWTLQHQNLLEQAKLFFFKNKGE